MYVGIDTHSRVFAGQPFLILTIFLAKTGT